MQQAVGSRGAAAREAFEALERNERLTCAVAAGVRRVDASPISSASLDATGTPVYLNPGGAVISQPVDFRRGNDDSRTTTHRISGHLRPRSSTSMTPHGHWKETARLLWQSTARQSRHAFHDRSDDRCSGKARSRATFRIQTGQPRNRGGERQACRGELEITRFLRKDQALTNQDDLLANVSHEF